MPLHSTYKVQQSNNKFPGVWLTMSETIVTVAQGKLQGAVHDNVLGSTYIAFKGVPFAAPPVGNLRFQDPQKPASWSGVKDVSKNAEYYFSQVQEYPPFTFIGVEDCLYLNIYTNTLSGLKPVMFWIHGGSLTSGSGNYSVVRPDYLLAKDIVLVTSNYRLGAFGFLNLGHRVAPGNMGLKDVIAALEWVHENIANFGGDPNNITIFGASAGGILVHGITISPRAKGLFHKAILQSGVLTCHWGRNQSSPERGFKLASILGKESTDPEEVIEFLRTIPDRKIAEAHAKILSREEKIRFDLPFGLNCDSFAENPVLPLPLEQLVSSDINIPVMIGYSSHELLMFIKDKKEKTIAELNAQLPQHAAHLGEFRKFGAVESQRFLEAVRNKYFDGEAISVKTYPGLIEFMTSVYFVAPVKAYTEDRVKRKCTSTYLYRFSYFGEEKTPTDLLTQRVLRKASHVDEQVYLFYMPRCKTENPEPPAENSKDRVTLERMTRLWTNFAKTGNPTPFHDQYIQTTWMPVTDNEYKCLDIDDEVKLIPAEPLLLDEFH